MLRNFGVINLVVTFIQKLHIVKKSLRPAISGDAATPRATLADGDGENPEKSGITSTPPKTKHLELQSIVECKQMLECCHSFLAFCAENNEKNQSILFGQLDVLACDEKWLGISSRLGNDKLVLS